MGLLKHKTEGGSGGKRGHSNMNHWVCSDEIKVATRKRRRFEAREIIRKTLTETVPGDSRFAVQAGGTVP